MVSGPYRPDKPKPPVPVEPTYNTVLQRDAPRAQLEQARRQFESALLKAGDESAEKSPTEIAKRGKFDASSSNSYRSNQGLSGFSNPPRSLHDKLGNTGSNTSAKPAAKQNSNTDAKPLGKLADNLALPAEKLSETVELKIQPPNFALDVQSDMPAENPDESAIAIDDLGRGEQLSVQKRSDRDLDEADHSGDAGIATMTTHQDMPDAPVVVQSATASSAHSAEQFETIEAMWNHLSLMDARSGPREWHFQIQNQDSAIVSVTLSVSSDDANESGWNVKVASDAHGADEAQACLKELQDKLASSGSNVVSLSIHQEGSS